MKRIYYLLFVLIATSCLIACSSSNTHYYDASANPNEQLQNACHAAGLAGKKVLLMVGGDWCPWCVKLNRLIYSDSLLLQQVKQRYEWVHIYTGKENRNAEFLESFGNPQKNGLPVFLILNADRTVVEVCSTASLEEGDGYNRQSVYDFITHEVPEGE